MACFRQRRFGLWLGTCTTHRPGVRGMEAEAVARAEARLGLGETQLAGHSDPTEVGPGLAIAFQREHGPRRTLDVRLAGPAAAVQADGMHGQHVQAEADRAFGEAGLEVEEEALAPLLRARRILVADVLVDVETRAKLRFNPRPSWEGRLSR